MSELMDCQSQMSDKFEVFLRAHQSAGETTPGTRDDIADADRRDPCEHGLGRSEQPSR
jgi:hypothetical protein